VGVGDVDGAGTMQITMWDSETSLLLASLCWPASAREPMTQMFQWRL